jgi:hypothetical protein
MTTLIPDGRERFLRSIAERVSLDRIEEVYLFPPLRQGGRESGVAVITVRGDGTAGAGPEGSSGDGGLELPVGERRLPERLTVLRARYRLTLKGPDRGKWEMEITEEADAPPSTVDEVVRGVHERAGGDDEPERLAGETLRAALSGAVWTATQ